MLKDLTLYELKKIVKDYNLNFQIKGYSKMKKNELINELNKRLNQKSKNQIEGKRMRYLKTYGYTTNTFKKRNPPLIPKGMKKKTIIF